MITLKDIQTENQNFFSIRKLLGELKDIEFYLEHKNGETHMVAVNLILSDGITIGFEGDDFNAYLVPYDDVKNADEHTLRRLYDEERNWDYYDK